MVSHTVLILLLSFIQIISIHSTAPKVSPDDREKYVKNIGWLFDLENSVNDGNEKSSICETDACKKLAEHLLKGMNKSAQPCDDFYAYACGGWTEDSIPPEAYSWGNSELLQDMVFQRMADILASEAQPAEILPLRLAKKWYKSCADVEEREARGVKPVESILLQGGGWPMIMQPEEWDESDYYSWKKIEDHYFYITGSFIFYNIAPSWRRIFDEKFKGEISISEGELPLSVNDQESRVFTAKNNTLYKNLIKSIAKVFVEHSKADVSDEMIENDINELVEFEKKIREMIPAGLEKEETTIGAFTDTYNEDVDGFKYKIDFRDRLEMIFDMDHMDINDSTPIMVMSPKYYANLTQLLSETSPRIIANYLHWNFVSNVVQFTSENILDILFKTGREVTERKGDLTIKDIPVWKRCMMQRQLIDAPVYAFVMKYFEGSTEKATLKMIENIRKAMESTIDQSNWLDDEAKELAKDKLHSIKMYVGFPDWYRNRTAVMGLYKGLKIGSEYFENMLNYHKYEKKMKIDAMRRNDAEGAWGGMSPAVVNAWYDPDMNHIGLPAANFQPPLFGHQFPESINYAVAGTVVGHEIGHAFDVWGIKYGKDGNHTKLSNQIIQMYYKQAKCFLNQYNEYYDVTEPIYDETTPEYGEGSFGRRTRGENIADNTGLDAVFVAYQNIREKILINGDAKLPGFEEYSDDQMFFLSYAASWCEISRPNDDKDNEDLHSPGRLRVIGPLSNSKEFAKAFSCPQGTAMNPEDKCSIWKVEEAHMQTSGLFKKHRRHSSWIIN